MMGSWGQASSGDPPPAMTERSWHCCGPAGDTGGQGHAVTAEDPNDSPRHLCKGKLRCSNSRSLHRSNSDGLLEKRRKTNCRG